MASDTKTIPRQEAIKMLSQEELKRLSESDRNALLLDFWPVEPTDVEFGLLPPDLQRRIAHEVSPGDARDPEYDPMLLLALAYNYRGVRNEYLAEEIRKLGMTVTIEGEPEETFECPCCGYRSLDSHGEYDICRVCYWEDNGARNADDYSGPNHMTLKEGRENFARFGACKEQMIGYVDKDGERKFSRGEGAKAKRSRPDSGAD